MPILNKKDKTTLPSPDFGLDVNEKFLANHPNMQKTTPINYNLPLVERNKTVVQNAKVNANNRGITDRFSQQRQILDAQNSEFGGEGNPMFVSNNSEQLQKHFARGTKQPTKPGAFDPIVLQQSTPQVLPQQDDNLLYDYGGNRSPDNVNNILFPKLEGSPVQTPVQQPTLLPAPTGQNLQDNGTYKGVQGGRGMANNIQYRDGQFNDTNKLPYLEKTGYISDQQMKDSGRLQQAQDVHQNRLADIARMQDERMQNKGGGAKLGTLNEGFRSLPGPSKTNNTAKYGSKRWKQNEANIANSLAGRKLDIEENRNNSVSSLGDKRLNLDSQKQNLPSAANNIANNRLLFDKEKLDFEKGKFKQGQARDSRAFDSDPKNIVTSDIFKQILGEQDPNRRAHAIAKLQSQTGYTYEELMDYKKRLTQPRLDDEYGLQVNQ